MRICDPLTCIMRCVRECQVAAMATVDGSDGLREGDGWGGGVSTVICQKYVLVADQ